MLKRALVVVLCLLTPVVAHAGSAVVTNGRFTNVYVYPDPSKETWEQHMARLRPHHAAEFSRANIDHYTEELMAHTWPSYFDALHQYNGINPPQFFGSYVASQSCVNAALKDLHNGVLQWDTIRSLSNCHVSGHDPSPQVTLIFSPDIKIGSIPKYLVGTTSDMCAAGVASAWHASGLNTPNYIAMPTSAECVGTFKDFTRVLSHEIVETISDPAGFGMGDRGKHELGDNCESRSDATTTWRGYLVSRYWSNFDDTCVPRLDPPKGSVSDTWVLGEGSPLQRQTGDVHALTLKVPPRRTVSVAPITQLLLVVQTGGDDLRGGSQANATLLFQGGHETTVDINGGRNWKNGETHVVALKFPRALRESLITGVTISTHFGGNFFQRMFSDNWNIDKVALVVSRDRRSIAAVAAQPIVHTWLDASGGPLIRFTGHVHDENLAVRRQDVGVPVTALQLILSTGNDDLRGGSHLRDDCDVTIGLAHGNPIHLQDVNNRADWHNWTDHTVNIPVPAGLKGGDVTSVNVHTNFGGGFDGDNWNLQRVRLVATLQPPPTPIHHKPTHKPANPSMVYYKEANLARGIKAVRATPPSHPHILPAGVHAVERLKPGQTKATPPKVKSSKLKHVQYRPVKVLRVPVPVPTKKQP